MFLFLNRVKRICSITILLIIAAFASGQEVILADRDDRKPLQDVAMLGSGGRLISFTGNNGEIDISGRSDGETLCFQLFGYERSCLTVAEIRSAGDTIFLARRVFEFEEFVISANRWEQERATVPNRISVIPSQSIVFNNPQTAADLIASSGEVYVQKSQLGGGSPMIRGFATNRVLIVIDGVRMNNAIYREGNIQNVISLDPNVMQSAEIIFGPGAVVYGSDAIGGVMDFHSDKVMLSPGKTPVFKSEAFLRYSSADNEKTSQIKINGGFGKTGFLASITYSSFDDLRMGSRRHPEYRRPEFVQTINGNDTIVRNPDPDLQVYSGYSQINTTFKFRIQPAPNLDVVLANHYSALSSVPRYDRLIQYKAGKLRYGEWYYGPQLWMMNNLQINYTGKSFLFDEIKITAARQDYRESRHDRAVGKLLINEQFEKVTIYSLNTDFDKTSSNQKHLFFYGTELFTNDIKSVARTRDIKTFGITPAGSRYPDGKNKYAGYSVYAGYKFTPSGKLSLNTGLRYNYVSLNSTIADNSYYNFPFTEINIANSALTGSAGISLNPGSGYRLTFNISTGFRAPNLDDAGKVFDSAPGIVVVPNPDLKPEYAVSGDAGIEKNFGEFCRIELNGFYTWLKNAMVRRDFLFNGADSIIYQGELSKVEAIVNAGYARVYGVTAALQTNFTGKLYMRSLITLMKGTEEGGTPLRHASPLFGSSHLVYERGRLKADLNVIFNGPKTYKNMPPSEISKPYMYATDKDGNPWSPGWYTLNFKAIYRISPWALLSAGCENILDHRYRPYSWGIVAPGRNLIISLRVLM